MRERALGLVAAGLALVVAPGISRASDRVAGAEESRGLAVGSTIRLSMPNTTDPVTGVFAGWQGEHLSMTPSNGGQRLAVSRGEIDRLEVLTRPSRRGKGALIGASVLAGTVVGLVVLAGCGDGDCDEGRIAVAVLGAAGLGAGLGTALAPGARWADVPLGPPASANRVRATVGLIPGGVTGFVHLSF